VPDGWRDSNSSSIIAEATSTRHRILALVWTLLSRVGSERNARRRRHHDECEGNIIWNRLQLEKAELGSNN
jgi:hypothetical protein